MFKVIYIRNADPVYFSELDDRLANSLREFNVEVTMVELEDIHFEFENGVILNPMIRKFNSLIRIKKLNLMAY